jgi:hypothetical protein
LEFDVLLTVLEPRGVPAPGATRRPLTTAADAQFLRELVYSRAQGRTLAVWDDRRKGTWDDLDVLGATVNDDRAVLQFSAPQFKVKEGLPGAIVTVKRTGVLTTAATVSYATSDGTALRGADYTAVSGTLSFGPGVVSRTFSVPILNDAASEPPELVVLSLTSPAGGVVGPQDTATLLITDDDSHLFFSAPVYVAAERGRAALITVKRGGAATNPATVQYASADGTARAGEDYTATSGMLSFGRGVLSRTFTVPILNDSTAEPTETVSLSLSNPVGASLGLSSAQLSIKDDEPVVSFSMPSYSVSEGVAAATIVVKRTGSTAVPVVVHYTTADGTAVAGMDYKATSGELSFGPGVLARTFRVEILNDGAPEAAESVNLALSDPVGASLGLSSAELKILDDDPAISFSAASYVVSGAARAARITVRRSGVLTGAATVNYATGDGTATEGSDYTSVWGVLSFGPGVAVRSFLLPILADSQREGDETVNLTLDTANGGAIGQGTATLTIRDDDVTSVVELAAAGFSGSEAGGEAVLTVKRTGGAAATVTVDYATSDGTAVAGEDYTPTGGTLTFAPGELVKTITVPVLDDGDAEANETLIVSLGSPGGGAVLGRQTTAVVFIASDE